MASQITGVSIVCSTVCSSADKRKHQSSASLAFLRGIHRWPVVSPHKGPVTWKCIHLMTSSWHSIYPNLSLKLYDDMMSTAHGVISLEIHTQVGFGNTYITDVFLSVAANYFLKQIYIICYHTHQENDIQKKSITIHWNETENSSFCFGPNVIIPYLKDDHQTACLTRSVNVLGMISCSILQ